MRAREFISEGRNPVNRSDASHEFERAHPGMITPGGRGDIYWGRYYDFYRVCSLAGMDPKELAKTDDINFFGNLPIFSAYTDYDRDKLKAIMKKLKMKPRDSIGRGSLESDGTHYASPIKPFKGYKR